ncbi:MAG: cell division protein FtsL [Roseivirga sp.]|jgi:cell division protein FtsL
MDKKKLETLILVIGIAVVGAALALILMGGEDPNSPFYTNITFAVGFLFYIIYNMMATSGLQKEIKDLQNHVTALKEESGRQKKEIETKTTALNSAKSEISRLKRDGEKMKAENKSLSQELQSLKEPPSGDKDS